MRNILLFLLCLYAGSAIAQNTCATPVAITSIPYNSGTLTTCGSGNEYAAGTLFNANYGGGEDYVFSINITNAPISYGITLGGAGTWKIASVHSACPPTSANAIGGVVTGGGTTGSAAVNFPTNGTYYIIVDTWPDPTCGAFTLSVAIPPPAPTCTSNITPANGATNVAYLPATQLTWNAVATATSYDVYYSVNGTTYTNLGNTTATTVGITGNTPNTTYYWYIVPLNGISPAVGCQANATSFTTGPVPPPPANDSCGAAISLTASSTALCGTVASGTTVSATPSPGHPAPSCSATGVNDDVWYSFVATATTHKITINNISSAVAAAVYTGTNCSLTQITGACLSGGPTVSGLTVGTTYYIRVYTTTSTTTTYSNFNICVGVPPPPPVNDDCAGAITIGQYTGAVNGTTISASQSQAAALCDGATGNANDDVWFRFTTLQAGTATISLTNASSGFDAVMIGYSGTCGGILSSLGCADIGISGENETLTLTGLAAGTTYYFRVYGYGGAGTEGTFTLNASGTALPVTGVTLSGIRNGNKAQLSWQTLTEINNAGFELQRSADGRVFAAIAQIASKANGGNSTAAINYAIDDAKPLSGANYYRLKQTDKDGKINYSNIVYLKGVAVTDFTLSALYPNPTTDVLKAAIQAPTAESITLIITDMMGKTISRQVSNVTSGDNTVTINVVNLPAGSYLLKAVCRNGCETTYQKFTKQ